ncbi:hypothetical protein F7731_08595 [Cytobacillus depressus]|uniref:Uncharacterized protein n=1 Tax=Cytobacillus depressus TaxID=1602942 RepID=A0A6L3VAU0_9BACI|nr:hypothetical protein [Cytobacillus depressus]KAB2337643.1 hypothetical protein F7731_08595 [Cytobacillus depressus]
MSIEINSEELIKDFEVVHEHYEANRKKIEELLEAQKNLFSKTIDQLKPAIDWVREKQLTFTHPRIKYQSGRGPIVGYNSKDNLLYVLEADRKWVIKVDLYSKEEKQLPVWKFIEESSFEDAMDGLLYIKKMINEYNNQLLVSINELESQLKKY